MLSMILVSFSCFHLFKIIISPAKCSFYHIKRKEEIPAIVVLEIPKLILDCSSNPLWLLKSIVIGKSSKSGQQQIDNSNNNRVMSQIAIQACRQMKCQQAKKEYENLSDVGKEIIDKIIFKARSVTNIAAEIRKDRTIVSRYLNELKDLDLITFNTQGREIVYKATLPTQILY